MMLRLTALVFFAMLGAHGQSVLAVDGAGSITGEVPVEGSTGELAGQVRVVRAFDRVHHAVGEGVSITREALVAFPADSSKVKRITMRIHLRCPPAGCNAWDVFANVRVFDEASGTWFELGRYITPYGVDTAKAPEGLAIDVTDFKGLLTGEVRLRSFVETYGSDGWLVSVDFEVEPGQPDYPYYAIAPLLDYARNSQEGVPYGVPHDRRLDRRVDIPLNAKETSLRTVVTGWGHALPADPGGRRCAEWCFRTHRIALDGAPLFQHFMGPIGCVQNPVRPQRGNWAPDRAGWCPGMAVPVRSDRLPEPLAGGSFTFSYEFEPWTRDQASNDRAIYALSSYVVVKSNEPIEPPVVQ